MATTQHAGHLITAWYRDTLVYIRLASFTYQWSIPTSITIRTPYFVRHPPHAGPFHASLEQLGYWGEDITE
jgi:hypothetical protein